MIDELIAAEEIGVSASIRIPRETLRRALSAITVTQTVVLELALPGPHSLKLIEEEADLYLSASGFVTGRLGELPVTVSL
jgi:hypothetical protein